MTESLMALALAVCASVLGWAFGRPLLRSVSTVRRWETLVFEVPLGLGGLALVVLGLGWAGLARASVLWPVCTLFGAAAWFLASRLPKGVAATDIGVSPIRGGNSVWLAWLLLPLGALSLIGALAPPAGWEWDSLSYQLAAPKVWAASGRIHYLPYDHHSNFPFTWNMLYLWMMASGSIAAAKVFHWLCAVLLCAAVGVFALRHLSDGRRCAPIAALALGSTPLVVWEATTAYVDLATALFTWLSVHALVNAASDVEQGRAGWSGSLRWLVVSAVAMGFALGTKMTCLVFLALGFVGIVAWHPIVRRRWVRESLAHAIGWAAIALAVGSVWYIKTWIWTGNPVYPFFWSVFGGKFWNAENAAKYAADQASFGVGKGAAELLMAPWNLTMERSLLTPGRPWIFTEYVDFGLAPFLLAFLLPLPLLRRRIEPAIAWVVLFGLGILLSWFVLMQQTRYLVPALPGFALAAAAAWSAAGTAVRRTGTVLLAIGGLWAIARVSDIALPAWDVVAGAEPRERYLARRLGPFATAQLWINRETPADAKVLMVDEPRGFWLDRQYAWAEPNHAAGLFAWDEYADSAALRRDMVRRGYRWVLWNRANAPRDPTRVPEPWRALFLDALSTGELVPAAEFGPALVLRFREDVP